MDQLCRELLAPANATTDSKDPKKLHYGCGVATTAQVNRVIFDLAALEPQVTAAVAQASSLQATFTQGSTQAAVLRARVDELTATTTTITANVQKLQASAANASNPGLFAQELAALTAASTRTAQQLALMQAANQAMAADIAALKSAPQQCACSAELSAVNTTLAAIKSAQAADAAAVNTTLAAITSAQAADAVAVSLVNATVESLKTTVTTGAAAIASANTSVAALAASVANVSAIDLSVYARIADLANINAVSLGGVPAAEYLRARVVIYSESSSDRDGNLGGRSGADALCSASINRPAGLARVHAFLSVSASDQIADFSTKYGVPGGLPIESLRGTVIARNFTGLLGGSILTSLGSAGVTLGTFWWSGSLSNGRVAAPATCLGWTSASDSGFTGGLAKTDATWLSFSSIPCFIAQPVLCIAY
ncbi:hypothetical protein MNEG_8300 [Monoraphidium neglectum]|uniref:Uncharacterized protein n=1 Tax=Monoraphidium neglectum TaxID=145388 RepID=A0A0D2N036_9CHLO|nr:hypothetical protein MNEG_8300 [Monoraphidium neglectum]KIY99660.1 hypothetical protein MNEG_8300 [Monoraphidium neglectum]|eukprot:XP_013898680.1 hypothetical protein MNEG_8300 [Monoraphidium neglectum]